jgi:DNA-binding FadR family transcriptional regulator
VIIEALKTRDPNTVEQILRDHYISSGERMAKYGVDFHKPSSKASGY